MPGQNYKSFATLILDKHPELRKAMSESERFAELKEQSSLDEVGGKVIYLVNDMQADEDTLYVDALVKGFKGLVKNKMGDSVGEIYRKLFLELDDQLKSIVEEQIGGEDV
jgi:hypothetical protein